MLRVVLQQCASRHFSVSFKRLTSTRLYLTQTAAMPFNGRYKCNTNLKYLSSKAQNMFFSTKFGAEDFNFLDSTKDSDEKLQCKNSKDSEFISEKESQVEDNADHKMTGNAVDIDAEMLRYDYEEFDQTEIIKEEETKRKPKKSLPISFTRGQSGVFEIEELCALLKNDNVRDICVIRVPPEFNYVDFLIFGTGRSTRHIRAVAEYIKWAYKQKRSNSDPQTVKIEGEFTLDWFALDLGNIAVHLMLQNVRSTYDLEQLWGVGSDFDEQIRLQSLSDVSAAASLEEFSFDSELERFRRLREEEAKQTHLHVNSDSRERQKKSKRSAKFNVERKTG